MAAGPAHGKTWGAPQAIGDGSEVAIASDRLGNALIGYANGVSVQARTRAPDGTLGPVQTLATAPPQTELRGLRIVMDGDGNAVAGWIVVAGAGPFQAAAATRAPGGSFGAPQLVATDVHGRNEFSLAVAAGGWAAMIWDHDGQQEYTEAAIRPPGLAFGAPERISPDRGTIDVPRIAIDGQGTATATWDTYSAGLAETATRPPQGPWGATEALGPARTASSWPSIGVDDQGNALAVFMADRASGDSFPVVRARYREAGGEFGPAEQVSRPAERSALTTGFFAAAPIGFDAAGSATVLWRDNPSNQLFASTRQRAGGFDGGTAVSTGAVEDARLAVAAGGAAFAIWAPPPESSIANAPRPVLAAARNAGAGFEPQQQLVDRAVDFDVAADAGGNGLAAWVVPYGGACGQVQVASYADEHAPAAPGPPPKPVCAGGTPPEPGSGTADRKPPLLKLEAGKRQRPIRQRRLMIAVRCSEACTAVARANVKLRGRAASQAAGRTKIAFKPSTKRLAAGKRVTMVLRLSARDAGRLARALAARRQGAAITVTAVDAAENRSHAARSVTLTR